jgi:hypothetical protein
MEKYLLKFLNIVVFTIVKIEKLVEKYKFRKKLVVIHNID